VVARFRLRPVRIRRAGDDTPARSLYGYVWRMSGWHQAWLALLAALVAGLSMAPLELQRRIVNIAIGGDELELLGVLAAVYLAVVVLQTGLKYLLRVGQGWVSESAIRYTRRHLLGIHESRRSGPDRGDEASRNERGRADGGGGDEGGRAVSIIGAEVEQLGGFAGEAVAEPLVSGGMMLAILGYMFVVEPVLAAACLAFFVPQAIGVPIIQRVVNRFIERRGARRRPRRQARRHLRQPHQDLSLEVREQGSGQPPQRPRTRHGADRRRLPGDRRPNQPRRRRGFHLRLRAPRRPSARAHRLLPSRRPEPGPARRHCPLDVRDCIGNLGQRRRREGGALKREEVLWQSRKKKSSR
jgi:ABC-type multidrug transport system fused ATPase/permease subunit